MLGECKLKVFLLDRYRHLVAIIRTDTLKESTALLFCCSVVSCFPDQLKIPQGPHAV